MTEPERDVTLPVSAQPSIETLVDHTRRAEELGYDRVWMPESWGRDAVTILAVLAERTDEVGLGSSICNVYSRSPALLGQTAATLQEVSGGRFRLGIGPSGPILIEGWHGVDFERPLRRTREAVEVIKTVTRGEDLNYDGEVFSLSGFHLRGDPPDDPPPVDVTGMGPKAVELAGRFADGWLALLLTPESLRDRLEALRRGAELGDRDVEDVRATLPLICCVLEDDRRARELASEHVAFHVGAMGTYYREAIARQGYEDLATEIAAAWANGERERATDLVEGELLDEFAIVGTPERARERLDRYLEVDGLDAVGISFPRGADAGEIDETMTALAPR